MSFLYVLTNEAMPGYIKIGITALSVDKRMISLDATGVPLPFECYCTARVNDMAKVEKALHDAFGDHRVRKSREFFQLDPYKAKVVLELLAIEEVTPRADVVDTVDDAEAFAKARRTRGAFNLSKAAIPVGAELTFSKAQGHTATLLDDRRIEFRSAASSLSAAALTIVHERGPTWATIAGPDYWLYEGETLRERRLRLEDASDEAYE